MNRITELFQRKDRNLLSVYFTAGYPVLEDTVEIIQMLENRGVDLVEIGIPFSDPMADGVVIQQSSTQALKNGMTLPVLLEQLTSIRSRVELPLLLMGYLNPMLQYGMENLFRKGMEIGIDGMIIPDLPFQEYLESVKPLCEKYDIPVIMLITPETSDERIRLIDEYCGGFIYMVSSASTTGVKDRFTAGQIEYFQRIDRLNLKNKRLIGFGISNGETLSTVCRYSSGAIIGSLFVKLLGTEPTVEEAVDHLLNSSQGRAIACCPRPRELRAKKKLKKGEKSLGFFLFLKKFKFLKIMASIRRLKKDIDCLTFAVVDDSLNCLAVGKSMDDISEIVQHIIDSRNDLRQRVNAGKQVAKADRKGYYRTIRKDLIASVDGAFTKLSDLVKQA